MSAEPKKRPFAIVALSIFFLLGSLISFTVGFSLLLPGSFLEPMWRFNPRGHEGLFRVGLWGVAMMLIVSTFCAAAAIGLWRRTRWGHTIAIGLITINLVSDVVNTVLGTEPRAIIGVPIALAILLYLMSRRVRNYFSQARDGFVNSRQ